MAAALGVASIAQAQETRVTGRAIDATEHTPIAGAAVLVSGTTIGVNTSDSGTFTLRVPASAHTLTVRRIGYLAQTVTLTPGKTDYTVALEKDVLRLEAQVVTGVATTVSTQNAANAVAVVNTQEVNEVPAPTVENAIQGQIPGAIIQQNNGGAPGGGMQVQIRGITSIYADASPLYIVDGVIVNNETINSGLERRHARRGASAQHRGQQPQPDRRHQSGRHREYPGPEGRLGLGDLRLQGLVRRRDHHHEERLGGQAAVELLAEGRPLHDRERARSPDLPDARERRRVGHGGGRPAVQDRGDVWATAGLPVAAVRQRAGFVRDRPERLRDREPNPVLPLGPQQVRQRHDDQHGLQQADGPRQRDPAVEPCGVSDPQHDVRPLRGPARRHRQREQRHRPDRRHERDAAVRQPGPPEPRRQLGRQPLRSRESVRRRGGDPDAGGSRPVHRRRQHRLDAL